MKIVRKVPNILIASRTGASEILCEDKIKIQHLISMGYPGEKEPEGYELVPDKLRLEFDDIIEPMADYIPPEREDVEKIIQFGTTVCDRSLPPHNLLIHCSAGIRRSTAAALAIFAACLKPGREQTALMRVILIQPMAFPNLRMVGFADEILGYNGKLLEITDNYIDSRLNRKKPHRELKK